MDISEIRKNIELLPDVIYTLEKDYLQAKAQLNHMNDLTKHLLAKWKSDYDGSNPEREQQAIAKEEYLTHLKGIFAQEQTTAEKASMFHLEERRFEAMRSLNKNV